MNAWKDATHQPPNDGQTVLACWDGTSCGPYSLASLTYHAKDAPDSRSAWVDSFGCDVDEPTHWQPLPEKPSSCNTEGGGK